MRAWSLAQKIGRGASLPLPSSSSLCARDLEGVIRKLGGAGGRFGYYLCVNSANLLCLKMLSFYKHKIHQTYYQNLEVYTARR